MKKLFEQYGKFFITGVGGRLAKLVLLWMLVEWVGVHYMIATILIAAFLSFIFFFIQKLWVFKK